jgi:hypothetical protein
MTLSLLNRVASLTANVVQVLKTVIRAGEEKSKGKSDDAFWENALDMLISNVIDLNKLAYGTISIQEIYDIVQTAPAAADQVTKATIEESPKAFYKAYNTARLKIRDLVKTLKETLPENEQALSEAEITNKLPEARLFKMLDQFFLTSFKGLSEKTRSIIDYSFSGFLFKLLREPVYSLFCRYASNVRPEDSIQGKIILLNIPVKLYHEVGRDSQIMFKYIWQRAMEKRDVTINPRPVFLWADEAQHFLHEYDAEYQATARSSRIATVYISQNLPNYFAAMGGESGTYKVKSFLGTLATKLFHANADMETNEYASELVGDAYFEDLSDSVTIADNFSSTKNKGLILERILRPESFVRLKTGGPKNNYIVEAVIHKQGDPFHTNSNHAKVYFSQKFNLNNNH